MWERRVAHSSDRLVREHGDLVDNCRVVRHQRLAGDAGRPRVADDRQCRRRAEAAAAAERARGVPLLVDDHLRRLARRARHLRERDLRAATGLALIRGRLSQSTPRIELRFPEVSKTNLLQKPSVHAKTRTETHHEGVDLQRLVRADRRLAWPSVEPFRRRFVYSIRDSLSKSVYVLSGV